jgi:hypothetical protein
VDEAVSGLDEFEEIVEFALVLLRDEGGPKFFFEKSMPKVLKNNNKKII